MKVSAGWAEYTSFVERFNYLHCCHAQHRGPRGHADCFALRTYGQDPVSMAEMVFATTRGMCCRASTTPFFGHRRRETADASNSIKQTLLLETVHT